MTTFGFINFLAEETSAFDEPVLSTIEKIEAGDRQLAALEHNIEVGRAALNYQIYEKLLIDGKPAFGYYGSPHIVAARQRGTAIEVANCPGYTPIWVTEKNEKTLPYINHCQHIFQKVQRYTIEAKNLKARLGTMKRAYAAKVAAEKKNSPKMSLPPSAIPREFLIGGKSVSNPYFRHDNGRYAGSPDHFDWGRLERQYVDISRMFEKLGISPFTVVFGSRAFVSDAPTEGSFLAINGDKNVFWGNVFETYYGGSEIKVGFNTYRPKEMIGWTEADYRKYFKSVIPESKQ
jgi:hypothetical protein